MSVTDDIDQCCHLEENFITNQGIFFVEFTKDVKYAKYPMEKKDDRTNRYIIHLEICFDSLLLSYVQLSKMRVLLK